MLTGCAGFNKNQKQHNDNLPKDAYYRVLTFKNLVKTGQSPVGSGLFIYIPGMIVEANIVTGQKTIMNYLLKPILKTKQLALRER